MIRAMFSAATGMIAQQMTIDVIANNLANVNTTGFKKSRVNFQDLLYETIRPPGGLTAAGNVVPEGIQIGWAECGVGERFQSTSAGEGGRLNFPLDLAPRKHRGTRLPG